MEGTAATQQMGDSSAPADPGKQQSSPLLRLPPPIRGRIYRYLGLAAWDLRRPYRFDLHGTATAMSWDAPKPSNFHGLLLSCRAIYTETAALLYWANQFALDCDYARGFPDPLAPLHALTQTSLACLANLKIVLNQGSCHHTDEGNDYPPCCRWGREDCLGDGAYCCKGSHTRLHHLPLLTPSCEDGAGLFAHRKGWNEAVAKAIVRRWHSAAECLSHITPGRLELAVVCDIDPQHEQALDIALSVTAPLRRLPRLKDCYVRLCETPDARLRQIAHGAVLQACRVDTPPYLLKPSVRTTLATLPCELRLRILEYTDLIVPSREVMWSRQDQGYVTYGGDSIQAAGYRYLRRYFDCWERRRRGRVSVMGCFCRRRHAAFTFACQCWAPPTPLFLVCRTLLEDARLVFFSGNRFIVHDYEASPPWRLPFLDQTLPYLAQTRSFLDEAPEDPAPPTYEYPNKRLAASEFLREIVPTHCLSHLRFLELVFPPYRSASWPQAEHPPMKDWEATVDWLRDKISAPALTIRLAVAEVTQYAPRSYSHPITTAEGDAIMNAYMALASPLKQLVHDGLAKFCASLPYPWLRTEESQNRFEQQDGWYWLEDMKEEVKARVEALVLGARFQGIYRNEPKPSLWQDLYYDGGY